MSFELLQNQDKTRTQLGIQQSYNLVFLNRKPIQTHVSSFFFLSLCTESYTNPEAVPARKFRSASLEGEPWKYECSDELIMIYRFQHNDPKQTQQHNVW